MSKWKQEIKELLELRKAGGITEAEFQLERKRIMANRSILLDVGSHVGSYEVVSFLGKGGIGRVYQVHHRNLEKSSRITIIRFGSCVSQHWIDFG